MSLTTPMAAIEPRSRFFQVVFIGSDEPDSDDSESVTFKNINWASIYSSETGEWSSCSEMDDTQWGYGSHPLVERTPPILFAGSLYFRFEEEMATLKFDIDSQSLSMLYFPAEADENADAILITTEGKMELVGYVDVGGEEEIEEDEEVGEAYSYIHIWTWRSDNSEWIVREVVGLEDIFHETVPLVGAGARPSLLGSIEGTDTVFMGFGESIFSVNLSSLKTTEMGPRIQSREVLPFTQFFTPLGKITVSEKGGIVSHEAVSEKGGIVSHEAVSEKRGIEGGSPLQKKAKIEGFGDQTDAVKMIPSDKPSTQTPAAAAAAESKACASGTQEPPQ